MEIHRYDVVDGKGEIVLRNNSFDRSTRVGIVPINSTLLSLLTSTFAFVLPNIGGKL
jgi:hypothetical protein